MDLNNYAVAAGILTFLCIGGTEFVKQAFAGNWKSVVIIAMSTIIGGLGGLFLVPAVGGVAGLVIGLSASGLVTGAQKIGEGTNSLPSAPKV